MNAISGVLRNFFSYSYRKFLFVLVLARGRFSNILLVFTRGMFYLFVKCADLSKFCVNLALYVLFDLFLFVNGSNAC